MKLYEINQAIEELSAGITVDEETGEVNGEALDRILALNMERQEILRWLAKVALNYRAEAASLKTEEDRLRARRTALEKKEATVLRTLDRECAGEKTDLGVATVQYRRTARVDVTDQDAAIHYLETTGHADCIKRTVELKKTELRRLLDGGQTVPGCAIVDGVSCSLK